MVRKIQYKVISDVLRYGLTTVRIEGVPPDELQEHADKILKERFKAYDVDIDHKHRRIKIMKRDEPLAKDEEAIKEEPVLTILDVEKTPHMNGKAKIKQVLEEPFPLNNTDVYKKYANKTIRIGKKVYSIDIGSAYAPLSVRLKPVTGGEILGSDYFLQEDTFKSLPRDSQRAQEIVKQIADEIEKDLPTNFEVEL